MGFTIHYLSFLFVLALWSSSVFSHQSSTQKSIMLNLFHFLHNPQNYASDYEDYIYTSYYYHNSPKWNASTNPCRWEGVICTNNSVTQLHLSGYEINNSSVMSIACQLQSLQLLDVSNNFLFPFPEDIFTICGNLSNLKSIDFSQNHIYGNLPCFNKGGFNNLESLDLSHNSLSGSIGAQLDGLVALKTLNLSSNYLTGSIPSNLLRNLKGLQKLDLSCNSFQGRIPEELANSKNLTLVDLSYNRLVGTLPTNVSSRLVMLRLGNNFLRGSILPMLSGVVDNLVDLDLQNNMLTGPIPAHLGLCQELLYLNLARNTFSGELPTELGNLKQLQVLSLDHNNFVGKIPREITQLLNLKYLNISWNLLSGSIPPSISDLTNLEKLDLSNNKLSGLIPRNIGNIQSLIELWLNHNLLGGVIPLMSRKIQILDLSYNKLSGNIPEFLEDMSHLSYLNLAGNSLSGGIPSQLGFWPLRSLNLSNNNLSGPIPFKLKRFEYEAFFRNRDLCGNPMNISCSVVEDGDASSKQRQNESRSFYVELFVSMGLGFYFGFWGVCGTLILKHTWRYAFFNFIDSLYNRIYVTVAIYILVYGLADPC